MAPVARAVAAVAVAAVAVVNIAEAASRAVTLSNVALPRDTNGNLVQTGETSLLYDAASGDYFYYANVWYEDNSTVSCGGIDCCPTSSGCASCCFTAPPFTDLCVYGTGHQVLVYSTPDFGTWTYRGVALNLTARKAGIEFRPQVVYSPVRGEYVMWYEDRWTGQGGYAVATSPTPVGPFVTLHDTVQMPGPGRVGDYDIFVDDDGAAYHVRTGMTVVKLSPDFTAPTDEVYSWSDPSVEGPAMFKRDGAYYITVGPGCCACRGGSDVIVYTATSPLGPFTARGSVGRNASQPVVDPHSPFNYVTAAQQTKVITVPDGAGGTQYLWLGNQWVTALNATGGIGGPRNRDLLYWSILNFSEDGNITQIPYQRQVQLQVPA